MKYISEEEREIPQYGVFKPGEVVDFNESLHDTGLFDVVKTRKSNKEEGEE
jgi:hypothetical protein